MKLILPILTLSALLALALTGEEKKPGADKVAKSISLAEIDGRTWLVDSSGKPFFAHGITHVSNNRAKFDIAKILSLIHISEPTRPRLMA